MARASPAAMRWPQSPPRQRRSCRPAASPGRRTWTPAHLGRRGGCRSNGLQRRPGAATTCTGPQITRRAAALHGTEAATASAAVQLRGGRAARAAPTWVN